ncbi:MAG TPA: peroxidase family protein, partial [Pyrinomonadaceae bacterium]|nr:peroxidase family protein [Pyrinomonadaceae bacterium]
MPRHWSRKLVYIVGEDKPIEEPDFMSGAPHHPAPAPTPSGQAFLKFGRMFGRYEPKDEAERAEIIESLKLLGRCMTGDAGACQPSGGASLSGDSQTPSGYTYFGQFVAHEITFHKTEALPASEELLPDNARTPQIDLDSLYGAGPDDETDAKLYEADKAHLRVGLTKPVDGANREYPNDLPRHKPSAQEPLQALVGDPRNDENLAVAQTHVAFISFHNKVVDALKPSCPPAELFERARKTVVQHFQWLILEDYLPRLVLPSVLNCVRRHPPICYTTDEPFMPVEFSVAAFRIGHSMVRGSYDWNTLHSAEPFGGGPAQLSQLFKFTNFSGDLGGGRKLPSKWIIDWRRFFDFDELPHVPYIDPLYRNKSRRIDTIFNLRLEKVAGYPHHLEEHMRAITVRNLLRGFSFGLPPGEEVAVALGETPLRPDEVRSGPHEEV